MAEPDDLLPTQNELNQATKVVQDCLISAAELAVNGFDSSLSDERADPGFYEEQKSKLMGLRRRLDEIPAQAMALVRLANMDRTEPVRFGSTSAPTAHDADLSGWSKT